MNPGETEALALLGGALFFRTVTYFADRLEKMRHRTAQIKLAADLLRQHYDALDKFVGDPAAPEPLQQMLLEFSDAAANEEAAQKMVELICAQDGPRQVSDGAQKILRQLDELRRHRPELVDVFDKSISSGMMAAFLRWDDTARMFDQIAARVAADPIVLFVRHMLPANQCLREEERRSGFLC